MYSRQSCRQRQHAEAEQVDLHQPGRVEVVLLPLDHRAARHARRLDRHDLVQRFVREHEPAHMNRTMPRQLVQPVDDLGERAHALVVRVEPCALDDARAVRLAQRRRRVATLGVLVAGVRILPPVAARRLLVHRRAECARGRASPRSAHSGSRTARTPRWASAGRTTSSAVAPASPSPSRRATASSPRCRAPSSLPSALATAPSLAASSAGFARSASAVAFAEKRSLSMASESACSTLNPSTRAASRTALLPR